MKSKKILGVIALALATVTQAHAKDLHVTAWGGSTQAAQKKVYYDPFSAKTGVKIVEDSWSGGLGILRTKVQGGNANWDVVQVEADELLLGCEEGLFEPLDWSVIGDRDDFMEGAATDCGVGAVVWTTGLAYDGNRLKQGPSSWADVWNLQKFPGKRAFRKGPKYTLEFALMADGVPAKDVYKVLSTPEGVDRAFRKLDQIKNHIVWWSAGAQGPQLIAAGDVSMGAIYISRAISANRMEGTNFRVVWPGSVYAIDYFVILKGSKIKDVANRFLAYATSADAQKSYPTLGNQGITNLRANELVAPDVLQNLPTNPANQSEALALDAEFWVENIETLTQRFNAWASQ
ncbi:ABC transporter substrate-binding protein [Bordetella sp. 15P40C-2]|uniref:ABC transporter substrate-binding protein n=1 Tax=Bordetella sp. 15P40C-2 TaxID=2572246 RepID=UPI00132A6882|nr:ABC transporter substrate-binding protein [Bordetella sp. 15P40C-2]MVW72704.1 extracellular solute-binding protein [Bordetella sp. 15P40C-2]